MMTNLVETPQTPEALVLDMPLEVVFERVSEDISLPLFRPQSRALSHSATDGGEGSE